MTSTVTTLIQHYDFEDPSLVEEFLKEHPSLVAALHGLAVVLRYHFPSSGKSRVRVIQEPTCLESKSLSVSVPLDMGPIQARTRMEQVDNEWWMQLPPEVASLIVCEVGYFKESGGR